MSLFSVERDTKTELERAKSYEKMVRPSGKHGSARLVVICVSLLGLALIADFLWASSSSSSSSNSAFSSYHDLILPSNDKPKQPQPKKVSFLLIPFMFIFFGHFVNFFGGFVWFLRKKGNLICGFALFN